MVNTAGLQRRSTYEEVAREVAEDILCTGPDSRLQVKRALNAQYGLVDFMSFWASVRGPEAREGMTAFAEKRPPAWVPKSLARGRL